MNTTTPPQEIYTKDGSKSTKNSENRNEKVENINSGCKYDVVKGVCDLHGCAVREIKRKKTSWVKKKSGLFGRQTSTSTEFICVESLKTVINIEKVPPGPSGKKTEGKVLERPGQTKRLGDNLPSESPSKMKRESKYEK